MPNKINRKTTSTPLTKRMLNFEEVAYYLGLAPQTVRNKYYAGEFPIPAKRIYSKILFDFQDVDHFADSLRPID